jgi:hypothetical protein
MEYTQIQAEGEDLHKEILKVCDEMDNRKIITGMEQIYVENYTRERGSG